VLPLGKSTLNMNTINIALKQDEKENL
jgi:hypothetical protein